jgi:hypothetical protein
MKTTDANESEAERVCFQCQQPFPDNGWFARIKVGDRRAMFCKPSCLEAYWKAKSSSNLATN